MPAKGFDCLRMKHEIQEQIARETEGMTTEELQEYMRRGAEEFRRTHKPGTGEPGGLKALFARLDRERGERGTRP